MTERKLQQFGTPDELFNHPATVFVAGFIGSPPMNLVPAKIVQVDGAKRLQMGAASFTPQTARVRALMSKAFNDRVVVGLRQSAITITDSGTPNSISTEVYTVEPTGDVTFVQARVGEVMCTLGAPNNAYRAGPGEPITVALDEDRLYLFDRESGRAITDS